ncbi:MAG: hypothetical protein AB7O26_14150 [Planctomycetaceae bacterium]
MNFRSIAVVVCLFVPLTLVAGCGGGEPPAPSASDARVKQEQKTLRKLESADEKEQVEGAREAARQFGDSKKEEMK